MAGAAPVVDMRTVTPAPLILMGSPSKAYVAPDSRSHVSSPGADGGAGVTGGSGGRQGGRGDGGGLPGSGGSIGLGGRCGGGGSDGDGSVGGVGEAGGGGALGGGVCSGGCGGGAMLTAAMAARTCERSAVGDGTGGASGLGGGAIWLSAARKSISYREAQDEDKSRTLVLCSDEWDSRAQLAPT